LSRLDGKRFGKWADACFHFEAGDDRLRARRIGVLDAATPVLIFLHEGSGSIAHRAALTARPPPLR